MFECDGGNGCARFSALPNNLEFELGTVKPPLGALVRASLALVCMIFIVHTVSGNQPLLNMTWPDPYAFLIVNPSLEAAPDLTSS
jgi:hypothetical protein